MKGPRFETGWKHGFSSHFWVFRASLVFQRVKNLPAIQETQVWSLGCEDPLEKGMATLQYSCLENYTDGGAWRATVDGVTKNRTRLKQLSKHAEWILFTLVSARNEERAFFLRKQTFLCIKFYNSFWFLCVEDLYLAWDQSSIFPLSRLCWLMQVGLWT